MTLIAIGAGPWALLASEGGGAAGGGGMLDTLHGLGIYIPLVIANIIVFLLFFFVIRSLLFQRVRRHMQARDEALKGEREKVAALSEEAASVKGELAGAKKALDAEAYECTQEQVRRGVERKAEALKKAHEEALAEVSEVRELCPKSEEEVLAGGHDAIVGFAGDVVRIATSGVLGPDAVRGEIEEGVAEYLRRSAS